MLSIISMDFLNLNIYKHRLQKYILFKCVCSKNATNLKDFNSIQCTSWILILTYIHKSPQCKCKSLFLLALYGFRNKIFIPNDSFSQTFRHCTKGYALSIKLILQWKGEAGWFFASKEKWMEQMKVSVWFIFIYLLKSVNKSRSVRSGQNSEARAVVLSGQLPLQLGQQAVAVHQAGEEEEQLRLGQGLAQTHLQWWAGVTPV